MSFNHAVVWLDHSNAHVFHFTLDEAESETMKSHSKHQHPRLNHGDSHAAAPDNTPFFEDIAVALVDAGDILIVGPAEEKQVFAKYLTAHKAAIAANVRGVETVDHPTDGQLLAFARAFFVKDNAMR